jgi:HPt (histidine-containing phosphotransfer) domain-containing protein
LAGTSVHSRVSQAPGGDADKLTGEAVDRAYLARFTLDNAALEREVLELFAAQAPVYLQRLREASTIKAWKEAAHTIKGSASAIGAWRLSRLAELAETIDIEVEALLVESHRDEAVAAVAEASDEVCRFIARLFPAAGA